MRAINLSILYHIVNWSNLDLNSCNKRCHLFSLTLHNCYIVSHSCYHDYMKPFLSPENCWSIWFKVNYIQFYIYIYIYSPRMHSFIQCVVFCIFAVVVVVVVVLAVVICSHNKCCCFWLYILNAFNFQSLVYIKLRACFMCECICL